MRVVTSSQMRSLDERTIDLGIPSRILMERAGVSVVLAMENELGDLSSLSYTVLCGKGNNGGDGLVVARTLMDYTDSVIVVLMSDELKGDPLDNLKVLERIGGEILVLGKDIDLQELEAILAASDVIVDALLGIGIKGDLREPLVEIVDLINSFDSYRVCVDIPTGVDSDTGKILGTAVECDLTVTFGLPKIGHVLYPGRRMTGKLKVASIGIPSNFLESDEIRREIISVDLVRSSLPRRPRDSNKGTFGKIMIIAGSKYYTGAPVLSGMGALRSGAGLVYVAVPQPYNTVVTTRYPELIAIPLPGEDGILGPSSLEVLKKFLDRVDVLAVGPGLTPNDSVFDVVREITEIEKPLVLDADALNVLAGKTELLKRRKSPTVITPHPGEFSRLTGKSVDEVKYNYELAEEFARENGVVVVLKSATTIVTDGDWTYFNLTGNTGLAKGGSGDILTGMVASFMAQGMNATEAAISAVYIHGMAADLIDTERSTTPSDVLDKIPSVFEKLEV